MRWPLDRERLLRFLRALGAEAESETRLYLTGGATAVLLGWRTSTIDIDVKLEPESDRLLRAIPLLKERLEVNVELASPGDFIPELPGWRERSPFAGREGKLSFHHYDFAAQALSKIERGHAQDLDDVREMLARGLVGRDELLERFTQIEPHLYRYPAIDPTSFRIAVTKAAATTT
ncbi:MAG TPA: DUF6036 family nucleotidyltransferase [Thermoanaerobaculia bacterium]|jgi:hypothetical protein|nr:DUF6036 family nucleotidyltransferase [Thermoanaerobaculia bacterium]